MLQFLIIWYLIFHYAVKRAHFLRKADEKAIENGERQAKSKMVLRIVNLAKRDQNYCRKRSRYYHFNCQYKNNNSALSTKPYMQMVSAY